LNALDIHVQDETTYKLMKLIEEEPHLSQREIAQRMGISLGKANYCLKSLIEKGFIKARNFYKASHKTPYIYNLTPAGLEEKARVTYRFLKHKMREYEDIKTEIERLKAETEQLPDMGDRDEQ
jgi:EPS-associated MarR family transcriptional regulator